MQTMLEQHELAAEYRSYGGKESEVCLYGQLLGHTIITAAASSEKGHVARKPKRTSGTEDFNCFSQVFTPGL